MTLSGTAPDSFGAPRSCSKYVKIEPMYGRWRAEYGLTSGAVSSHY
jgi:hypothetical protein